MPSKRKLSKSLFFVLIFIGTFLIVFGGWMYFINNIDKTISIPVASGTPFHSKSNSVRIIIPGVKIDLPISEGSIIDGTWQTSQRGASHLNVSANPGENGNVVIYGHNLRVVFGSLPYVSMGAKVEITTEDGQKHIYEVYEKKNVAVDDVSITYATTSEILTIYTCDGPLDKSRFVLLARPIIN